MFFWLSFFLLICSLSVDTFIAGISIGVSKIKIPCFSILIICFFNTVMLICSYLLGEQIQLMLSNYWIVFFSSFPFIFLGIHKIFESKLNILLKGKKLLSSKIQSFFRIYYDPCQADLDSSKTFSFKELILLAISLSLDNLAAGLSIGMKAYSLPILFIFNLSINFSFFMIGNRLFLKISSYKINWSFLCGILLIFVGIYRIFH